MNLIIITSLLNPINKPLSYCNKRSIYSIEERYQQTIITINSIKEKIPNYFIVLLEASNHIEQYENKLKDLVNEYYNFNNNKDIISSVESQYKGLGEINMLMGYLLNHNINKFNSLIKISGRYYLNDNFEYKYFENKNNIFRVYDENKNVSTRLYKIDNHYFTIFIENLKKSIPYLQKGFSVENVFYILMDYTNINKIGVSGNVAIDGNFINE